VIKGGKKEVSVWHYSST